MAIESQEEFQKILEGAVKKLQSGVKREDLLDDEKEAVSMYEQQMQNQQRSSRGRDLEDDIQKFHKLSDEHDGTRVIRFGDTHSSPDDLKRIVGEQIAILGGEVKDNDVFFHAGDLLEDFISFSDLQRGNTQAFLGERIAKDGGLEDKVAEEFKKSYKHILEGHGVSDSQLLEGKVSEQLIKTIQGIYTGAVPQFATQKEKEEYLKHYKIFEKHVKSAIKNDAKKKYEGYKKVLEDAGLDSDNLIIIPGNHDVPDAMYEVLGDYIPKAGEVFEKKGLKFTSPFHGSTGAFLGPEFLDTFGYVDHKERFEEVKKNTKGFQNLYNHLKDNGIDYISENDLSNLIERSAYRASLGIGKGYLAKYFDERIQKQMDLAIGDEFKGKIAKSVPKDVDFYLMHGQPNHPVHRGIEEEAIFSAIKKNGGYIMHGHEHGQTTHWDDKTLLLNEGEGRDNFGAYLYKPGEGVTNIFTKTFNKNLEEREYKTFTPKHVSVQKLKGME